MFAAVILLVSSTRGASPSERAAALVAKMTLDEKLVMLHGPATGPCCQCNTTADGGGCAYVGNVAGNTKLSIPPLTMNDGPQGFRDNQHPATTTAWPSGLTMAASFDVKAMREWGEGQGIEFFGKGANIQLGPGLCLARVPRNGRNFEYLSGEDPFLGHTLVQPVIEGIQSKKVIANAKHYLMNNQETNRNSVIENIDERTRYEMYLPPFSGAVAAGVGSIMCSYNKIRAHADDDAHWSCENPTTLNGDLKTNTKFKGFVMSDWGATHSTSIMAGLDVEMPGAGHMNPAMIKAGLKSGNITLAKIDDAVTRILYAMYAVGVMDEPASSYNYKKLSANVTTDASVASARRLSAASTVLLKNEDGILPLKRGKKIAVIGFGDVGAVVHGGGSGSVTPSFVATPLFGITAANTGGSVSFHDGTDLPAAVKAAQDADVAIVFVATLSHEGGDRASLSLDDGCVADSRSPNQCKGNANKQNAMVAAIAAAAPKKTVVVMSIPGAVLTPWSGDVSAVLTNFMPGQQAGNAIADVLFGDVNPSARLPITLPNVANETQMSDSQWPGLPVKNPVEAVYSEKLLVGYRYYDHHDLKFTTGYPFGHGLSYTTFAYSNIKVTETSVTFDVKNSGTVAGAEIAQLYLGFPASSGEPPKQLKGFEKLQLAPGASATKTFQLDDRSKSIWDVSSHGWAVQKGTFSVMVGSSSRDIRLTGSFTV